VLARALYDGGLADVATICATLGISRATRYRTLKPGVANPPGTPWESDSGAADDPPRHRDDNPVPLPGRRRGVGG